MDTLAKKIADAIDKFYRGFKDQKILKTTEEVEANTNENNLASAVVVGELINDLNQQPEFIYDVNGKIIGYKTPGGADTVYPFSATTIKVLSTSGLSSNNITISNMTHGFVAFGNRSGAVPHRIRFSTNTTVKALFQSVSANEGWQTNASFYEIDVLNNEPVTITIEATNWDDTCAYALIACDK